MEEDPEFLPDIWVPDADLAAWAAKRPHSPTPSEEAAEVAGLKKRVIGLFPVSLRIFACSLFTAFLRNHAFFGSILFAFHQFFM